MTKKIFFVIAAIALIAVSFAFTTIENNKNKDVAENVLAVSNETLTLDEEIKSLYNTFSANNSSVPSLPSFRNGMIGYFKLADQNLLNKEILTIIDFSISSTQKRMWVLDMTNNKVLFHTVVSHGKNTGGEFATNFSNTVNSLQSSLGFYVTGETYIGKNGLSMFIDGMEEEFNSKARERYVVVHGADYANPEIINKLGRLGRSYGCPAVPTALTQEIIDTIKDKSVLYIHSTDKKYLEKSTMIKA